MIELAEEPLDSRTVQYLCTSPQNDGGQFDSELPRYEPLTLSDVVYLVVVNLYAHLAPALPR